MCVFSYRHFAYEKINFFNTKNKLKYAIPQNPFSLDPAVANDLIYNQIVFNIFETLIRYDWNLKKYIPVLATSWINSPDNLIWIFHLRAGVTFHDGSPLAANAVKTSFERQLFNSSKFYKEDSTDTYGRFALKMIQEINVVDSLTVQFKLKSPSSHFLDNVACPYFSAILSPKALSRLDVRFGDSPVGTGPFKFKSWKKDEQIILEKYYDYWNAPPKINQVSYKIIPDLNDRIMGLKQGKLDIITGLSASSANNLYYDSEINVITQPIPATVFLGFNCHAQPFDDIRIRQAICSALDIHSMVSSLSRGFASVAQGPLPPTVFGFEPSIKQSSYNIEKAIELIKDAGYPKNIKAKLSYFVQTDTLRANPIAQYIKSQLKKIGVHVEIQPYNNWSHYREEILLKGKTDLFLDGWPVFTAFADNFLQVLFYSKSKYNFFNYSNPDVDKLLYQARYTLSKQTRKQVYDKVQHIIVDKVPAVFLSHPTMGFAVRNHVKNFETDPSMVVWLKSVELEKQ